MSRSVAIASISEPIAPRRRRSWRSANAPVSSTSSAAGANSARPSRPRSISSARDVEDLLAERRDEGQRAGRGAERGGQEGHRGPVPTADGGRFAAVLLEGRHRVTAVRPPRAARRHGSREHPLGHRPARSVRPAAPPADDGRMGCPIEQEAAAMEVKELGHIVLYVRDLDRSVRFYRDVLGWRQVLPADGEGIGFPAAALLVGVGPDAPRAPAHRGRAGRGRAARGPPCRALPLRPEGGRHRRRAARGGRPAAGDAARRSSARATTP